MTLRANITTTYQEANANPPRAIKNVQKKATDQEVHETEGNCNPMKPALKTSNRGAVSLTEHGGNRSAVRNSGQTSASLDVFKRSATKDKSIVAQGAGLDKPASNSTPDTNEREVALKPALAGYGPSPGKPIAKRTAGESPTSQKRSEMVAGRSQDMQSGSMIKRGALSEPMKTDEGQVVSSDDKPKAPESLSQSLPIATPPKIRQAGPSAKVASDNAVASFSNVDIAPASVSAKKSDQSPSGVAPGLVFNSPDEDAMQNELTIALQFGQTQDDNSQTDSATGGDVAKHLQSEGVFGISANGRNLGAVDFIRQKQFEYSMDQKPFTTDDLLLEAEKAVHGTLNSDQSSSVSKSLLQAAESINAYRNQSVKSSEHAEIAARPARVAASTGKDKA